MCCVVDRKCRLFISQCYKTCFMAAFHLTRFTSRQNTQLQHSQPCLPVWRLFPSLHIIMVLCIVLGNEKSHTGIWNVQCPGLGTSPVKEDSLQQAGAMTKLLNQSDEELRKYCWKYPNRQSESPGESCSIPNPVLHWKAQMQKTWKIQVEHGIWSLALTGL